MKLRLENSYHDRRSLILWLIPLSLALVSCALINTAFLSKISPTATFTAEQPGIQQSIAVDQPAVATMTATVAQVITRTGLMTVTPFASATYIPSAPASALFIRAKSNTHCRTGPSPVFNVDGYLLVTDKVPVLGKNKEGTWFYIQHPKEPGKFCWVWGKTTTVDGNISALAIIVSPPTPTAQAPVNFYASFSGIYDCGSNYWLVFNVGNTGPVALESSEIYVEDTDTGYDVYKVHVNNSPFRKKPCESGFSALMQGETAYIAVRITRIPHGRHARASIQLCHNDKGQGICARRVLTFLVP